MNLKKVVKMLNKENENSVVISELTEDNVSKELAEELWDDIDTPTLIVLDDQGYNSGMVKRLNRDYWLYVDDRDGFDIVRDELVIGWALIHKNDYIEPEK